MEEIVKSAREKPERPVTQIFEIARDFPELPGTILEILAVKLWHLAVTFSKKNAREKPEVPVTNPDKSRVTGTFGCYGKKRH